MSYVAISEVAVPELGAPGLEQAFAARIRLVERAEGFQLIEVLRDLRRPGRYLMITHWRSRKVFRDYMRSDDHALSHARIEHGALGPRAAGFSDYESIEI
jgi:heme-degrading monooxygenase HmoA